MMSTPRAQILQGGMGIGVSGWRLARAVSCAGQMGVVSGTGLDSILIRRLQQGDLGGHVRRALARFPLAEVAERLIEKYFVDGGKSPEEKFSPAPMARRWPKRHFLDLLVAGNFVEVFLAREGHDRPVGVNYLEKLQLHTLPSLFGAMLAGVHCVLMGAGIPREIPGALDRFAAGQAAELRFDVRERNGMSSEITRFDPTEYWGGEAPTLRRPEFFAIIASAPLATMLVRKSNGRVDGFVIEAPSAGGHNAPPRGAMRLSSTGEPVYGTRDSADLESIRSHGLPFYLAGGRAGPDRLAAALAVGACGVQVGTAFAYCEESGFDGSIKQQVLELSRRGRAKVHTDPLVSPTGFPFKVVDLSNSLSSERLYSQRERICDLGYLREPYRRSDGSVGLRCPAEKEASYLKKEGKSEALVGRRCLCNALFACIGLGQRRPQGRELPLVTSGDDVETIARFLPPGRERYRAVDVIDLLLGRVSPA